MAHSNPYWVAPEILETRDTARRALKIVQDDQCAICLRAVRPLLLDHCHRCDRVRGLLCATCNLYEGMGVSFHRVVDYRANPPSLQHHIDLRYGNRNPRPRRFEGCGWCRRDMARKPRLHALPIRGFPALAPDWPESDPHGRKRAEQAAEAWFAKVARQTSWGKAVPSSAPRPLADGCSHYLREVSSGGRIIAYICNKCGGIGPNGVG